MTTAMMMERTGMMTGMNPDTFSKRSLARWIRWTIPVEAYAIVGVISRSASTE